MDKSLHDAGRLLAAAHSVIICTHLMPDGDGLGAEVALFHCLKRLGKDVRIVNPDPVPGRYRFLDRGGVIETLGAGFKEAPFDLAVVVDTNEPKRLGKVWDFFERQAKTILFLDHHHGGLNGTNGKVHTVVDVRSSSIGELLYRLFHQAQDVLDPDAPSFRLSPEMALGLYVSIITDTNSFRYSRTTALSHRIAAELIDFGLQPEEVYQNIYSSKSAAHVRLIGEVLSRIEEVPLRSPSHENGTLAWVEIPRDVRKKFNASSDDTQSIVNFLLLLKNAEILILLREEDDGRIKGSIKSKGTLVVNTVAQELGGGGHEFAAGFIVSGTMSEIRDRLLRKLAA
ncbi:MAG TPA: bifunctional oligoribonuclease/PAP phosphatase NrnA [Oligoflexia bacterium]|nr:bifunctional oligoribonuclease/PAP phosphatase NrnA [Oligoflexia bacterium]